MKLKFVLFIVALLFTACTEPTATLLCSKDTATLEREIYLVENDGNAVKEMIKKTNNAPAPLTKEIQRTYIQNPEWGKDAKNYTACDNIDPLDIVCIVKLYKTQTGKDTVTYNFMPPR
ncbi:hypothetical protein ACLI09_07735 [Flavobacterium sp. RHBU_24]|uniref:hypothetical protein n=1 Tax=Flavobacterium sp. RHBU_24 TaxID=3391185 RepID=UPI0039855D7F